MLIASALLSSMVVATTGAQQSVLLRFKDRPGNARQYAVKIDTDMRVAAGGNPIPMKVSMSMLTKETVKSVASDGSATLETQILKADSSMNGKPMPTRNSLVGTKMTQKRGPTGKVSGMKTPGGGLPGMNMDLGSMQVGATFPQGQVRAGSHWAGLTNLGQMGSVQMKYTLDRIASSGGSTVAYIRSTGRIDLGRLVSAMMSKQLPGSQMEGTADVMVIMAFNVTKGTVQKVNEDAKINMDMSFNNPQTGKPMKTHTSGTTTMTMQLKG